MPPENSGAPVTHRLFVAIDTGAHVAAALGRAMAAVRARAGRVAWAPDDRAHLTLVFLGAVAEALVPPLRDAVCETAARHRPLVLRVHGAGVFGPPMRARVLWAGVDGDLEALVALVADLRRAIGLLGLPIEDRPFHPHVTLARARHPRGEPGLAACAAALQDHTFGQVDVRAITLVESELGRSGARHHVVEVCPLDARD